LGEIATSDEPDQNLVSFQRQNYSKDRKTAMSSRSFFISKILFCRFYRLKNYLVNMFGIFSGKIFLIAFQTKHEKWKKV